MTTNGNAYMTMYASGSGNVFPACLARKVAPSDGVAFGSLPLTARAEAGGPHQPDRSASAGARSFLRQVGRLRFDNEGVSRDRLDS
jgi:hypothetical protein